MSKKYKSKGYKWYEKRIKLHGTICKMGTTHKTHKCQTLTLMTKIISSSFSCLFFHSALLPLIFFSNSYSRALRGGVRLPKCHEKSQPQLLRTTPTWCSRPSSIKVCPPKYDNLYYPFGPSIKVCHPKYVFLVWDTMIKVCLLLHSLFHLGLLAPFPWVQPPWICFYPIQLLLSQTLSIYMISPSPIIRVN